MKPLFIGAAGFLALAAAFASVGSRTASQAKATPWRVAQFENVLGTSMEIKLLAASQSDSNRAEAAALSEIKRLNAVLSGYDPSSEFSRWAKTRDKAVPVSSDLMQVLALWDSWRARTGGALNPAAEAVTQAWKKAEASARPPSEAEMAAAASAANQSHWRLDKSSGVATRLTDTPLMLNSFTKSYIVERAALAALKTPGVSGVVVNIGGDLVVRGAGTDSVAVADPHSDAENSDPIAVLDIRDRAVATSGNYRRGFDIGGTHYSHIVDPRTGHTADAVISATVAAPKAVDAGALATTFCVLSPEESRDLAASVPGAQYLIIEKSGVRHTSPGWSALFAFAAPAAAAPQNKSGEARPEVGLWDPAFELTIHLELPQMGGFGARRPYVAVWIENQDHFPVRTIAVWHQKPRYLEDLRAWYRAEQMRAAAEKTEILRSVSGATRAPGKYSFVWDGKDNSGKLVKAGKYTVLIEAAREHGGYNLVHREMDFNGEPAEVQIPAQGELGAISLHYAKVSR